jgi:hypothetical protein
MIGQDEGLATMSILIDNPTARGFREANSAVFASISSVTPLFR